MKIIKGLLKGLIVFFTIIQRIASQSERDIILTPNLALEVIGKTLYFKPLDSLETNTTNLIPWEQTLKYVTYQIINNQNDEKSTNLSASSDYQKFLQSPYIPSNEYISKFGDIITLAKGRLEKSKNNEYKFIEGLCLKKCIKEQNKLIASWIVQKIRHRDEDRKFRYEIKFSISPNISDKSDSKREIGKKKIRAFVLKDDDYPNNFIKLDQHIAQRRYDDQQIYNIERQSKFNNIFSQSRYFRGSESFPEYNKGISDLNTGEYIRDSSVSERIGSSSSNKMIFPTTYRPIYSVKLSKSPYTASSSNDYPQYDNNIKNPMTQHHLHHHYYVTKSNPILNTHEDEKQQEVTFPYLKDHRGAIDIIEKPLKTSSILNQNSQNYHTPAPISNQIPIPPNMSTHIQITQAPFSIPITNPIISSPPVIYMQPLPITHHHHVPLYVYPRVNNHHQNEILRHTLKPFEESQKDDSTRYSEPDPLYHNVNINFDNDLPIQNEPHSVEITSSTLLNHHNNDMKGYEIYEKEPEERPDSINAQLPPPENDQDFLVPYVETSIVTQTSVTSSRLVTPISQSLQSSSSSSSSLPGHVILPKELDNTNFKYIDEDNDNYHEHFKALPTTITSLSTLTEATSLEKPGKYQIQLENGSKSLENFNDHSFQESSTSKSIHSPSETTNSFKKIKSSIRSTIEPPILKWKPKRTKLSPKATISTTFPSTTENKNFNNKTKLNSFPNKKLELELVPVDVSQRFITVTSSPLSSNDNEVQTKQSVSTSISIKVGPNEKEKPFIPTINVPNVELYQANLENLQTNSSNIKLYMASDQRRLFKDHLNRTKDKKTDLELANTLVKHVQSVH